MIRMKRRSSKHVCHSLKTYGLITACSIIAIHGLGANVDWTWTRRSKDRLKHVNWLRDPDMLPRIVPKARIMVYTYNPAWLSSASKTVLQQSGEDMMRRTHDFRNGKTNHPIIFIGHSLGGIVIEYVGANLLLRPPFSLSWTDQELGRVSSLLDANKNSSISLKPRSAVFSLLLLSEEAEPLPFTLGRPRSFDLESSATLHTTMRSWQTQCTNSLILRKVRQSQ
jgi:hypothetical protein